MATATGKGGKLVLLITAACLVCMLGYSLYYRVQNPFLAKQSRQRTEKQAQQESSQKAMERIAQLMSRIQENPEDVQALSEVARLFMSMQSFEQAARFWERVLRVRPNQAAARQRLAMCYFQLDRHQDAAGELRRVLELDPDNAYAHYNLGVLLTRYLDRQEEGRNHFRHVLDIEEADAELKERARRELSQSPSSE